MKITTRAQRSWTTRLALLAIISLASIAAIWTSAERSTSAAGGGPTANMPNIYAKPAPDYDLNLARGLQNVRQATGAQTQALTNLKAAVNAPNMTARWNDFGGSPDMLYDFASAPLPGTPEEAARAFLSQNAALFGINYQNDLRVFSARSALGGTLIRFQQLFNILVPVIMNTSYFT